MTAQDPARFAASPKSLGYRMPAEYAPHKRTWMMWPTRAEVWPDMAATKADYAKVAQAIAEFEPLYMAVNPADAAEARAMLGSGIEIFEVPIDDSWARDAGPNFVLDGKGGKAASLFTFSAWGHKYAPFDKDAAFGAAVAAREKLPVFKSPLLAEGGGVTVDGEGTIITTETCFLNRNRNPSWSCEEVTRELLETLGGEKVIWLPGNADETETDGHVDGIAVFVAPGVVLIEGADDPTDPWRATKQANIDALRGQTDANGREIRMVTIPEAEESCIIGEKFCRSYVNCYFVNGGVIMPEYGTPNDAVAREIFQGLFPSYRIRGVHIPNICLGGGGIHCITQQEPA